MAKKSKAKLPGCIYKKRGRYYWKVKLPGKAEVKARPLVPTGGRYATKDKGVAVYVAEQIWTNAVFHADVSMNVPGDGSLASLVRAYLGHADAYYRHADGTPTKSPTSIRQAMKPLIKHFGTLPAEEFGPLKLKEIRKTMLGQTRVKDKVEIPRYCRKEINKRIGMMKSMVKWAVSEELLPASCYHALQTVRGLEIGRSTAVDHPRVQPADIKDVEAVLPYTAPVVAAMVRLQLLTGMRFGELTIMRPCDVDTKSEKDVWLYRLPEGSHKTAHHGHDRTVAIGPRGQDVLRPYLLTGCVAIGLAAAVLFVLHFFVISRIIFPGDCLVCTGVKGFSAVGRGSPPGYPMPERP